MAVTYVDAFVVTLPWFLLGGDLSGGNEDAPGNALAIAHEPSRSRSSSTPPRR